MLYSEKFEPIADIGFSVQFAGGKKNLYNFSKNQYGHYEVQDIKPIPEYYLNPLGNNNASPVISSLQPSQTALYNGNDLELADDQIGQFRYSVITPSLQVNLQFGKGGATVYRTKGETGYVDSLLTSTLYQMTEFYTMGREYPFLFLENVGSTALTSAEIIFSGYVYNVEFVAGESEKTRILPLLGFK